jgi:RNA polymerase sigma factor (sigma-70 family)
MPMVEEQAASAELAQLADAELLANPDPDAFAEFYRRHARKLAGYLMRATGDAEATADLTAETFAAALAGRSRYRSERASAVTWLFGIAVHKLRDWERRGYAEDRARRRLGIERPALAEDDVRELEYLGGEVTVTELLHELPEDQRAALRARLLDEQGYAEIAGAAGVSEAAIRQRVSRGLAGLRRRIGGGR